MQLKEEFATKLEIYGGPAGFEKWMSQYTHRSCTDEVCLTCFFVAIYVFFYPGKYLLLFWYSSVLNLATLISMLIILQEKAKVGKLIFNFVVGFDGLLSSLVQGWTSLGPAASDCVQRAFEDITGPTSNMRQRVRSGQGKGKSTDAETTLDSASSTENTESDDPNVFELKRRSPRLAAIGKTGISIGSITSKGECSKKPGIAASQDVSDHSSDDSDDDDF